MIHTFKRFAAKIRDDFNAKKHDLEIARINLIVDAYISAENISDPMLRNRALEKLRPSLNSMVRASKL
jgi:hypothetical protein